jgi:energy-coupling factor transport system permease protein
MGPRQHLRRARALPRSLHPVAWWLWALGLAATVSRTTNPILLLLVLGVLGFVVTQRRSEAPWARAFKYYLVIAFVVIAIRIAFRSIFGGDIDAKTMHVLFTLPHIPLPKWASGVQLGGPITLEGTLGSLYDGLQLGTLLCCIGAANSLANPKRALRVLPGALYELGVAVVIAISFAPQLVESVQRVRRARALRGGSVRGFHAVRSIAVPVLEDALERSLLLAASMDSRGYGRTAGISLQTRRVTGALIISGMCGLCIGAYALLDGSLSGSLGLPAFLVGTVLCCGGLALGGKRVRRSQYRPDPWRVPEWIVTIAGLLPAVVAWAGIGFASSALNPSTQPIAWPSLPLLPAITIVFAAIAGVATPPPTLSARAKPEDVARVATTTPFSMRNGKATTPAELPA